MLLPTGSRPEVDYIYVLRPQASTSRDGWHVELTVYALREDGGQRDIFSGNLHRLNPDSVQGRGVTYRLGY